MVAFTVRSEFIPLGIRASFYLHHLLISQIVKQRLVRFLAHDKRIYHGDALLSSGVTDISRCNQARIIKGDIFGEHEVTNEVVVCSIQAIGRHPFNTEPGRAGYQASPLPLGQRTSDDHTLSWTELCPTCKGGTQLLIRSSSKNHMIYRPLTSS